MLTARAACDHFHVAVVPIHATVLTLVDARGADGQGLLRSLLTCPWCRSTRPAAGPGTSTSSGRHFHATVLTLVDARGTVEQLQSIHAAVLTLVDARGAVGQGRPLDAGSRPARRSTRPWC